MVPHGTRPEHSTPALRFGDVVSYALLGATDVAGRPREDGLRLHSFSFHVPLSQIIVDEEAHLTFLFLDGVTRMV